MKNQITRFEIPAGKAISVCLSPNQIVRIVNTEGGQVVDTWAFNPNNPNEYLSMEHSRSALYRLWFQPGDTLVNNNFEPVIKISNDTSPGMHDTLHAACSEASYRFYGQQDNHPNCQNNLKQELKVRQMEITSIPCPWNLFEHALVNKNMELMDAPASAKTGDYVELTVLTDLILVCSACPSTVGNISGRMPTGAQIEVLT